jgi:hypothetical protein
LKNFLEAYTRQGAQDLQRLPILLSDRTDIQIMATPAATAPRLIGAVVTDKLGSEPVNLRDIKK